jgi:hypothetical protein
MKSISLRRPRMGRLAVVALVVASSAHSAARPASRRATPAPGVHLVAFGSRSPAQWHSATLGKLDGALADLARHAYRVRAGHALEDLHSLSPAARFAPARDNSEPLVLVDAVTRGDPQRLLAALLSLGLEHPSLYINDVSGWLPVRQIEAAAARAEVHSLRAAMPHTRAGAVTSQGDFAQGSATLRSAWPTLDGTGITVGVLSDSFNCYAVYAQPGSGVPASGATGYASNGFTADAARDTSTGDLPASVRVLQEAGTGSMAGTCMDFGKPLLLPYGDEGRAMLQIVHDVAPGASLAFHTAVEGEADFASGITALAAAGARVIADDIGYFSEPFFQDSLVGQAIDTVASHGVAYFSAAGNDGQLAYDNLAPHFNTASTSPPGEMLLNFDLANPASTTATTLPVTIVPASTGFAGGLAPGEFVAVVVEWDQPYLTGAPGSPGASSRIDVCVTPVAGGTDTITGLDGTAITCTGPNQIGVDALQIVIIGNPANSGGSTTPETVNISVGLLKGTPMPARIKIAIEDNGAGSTINSFFAPSPTLQGHPGAAGAAAVGAAFYLQTPQCGTTPALLEPFSSAGGDPILFDTTGTRLATPVVRHKPDFVAPDAVNNTFLGFVVTAAGNGIVQCRNNPQFPLFAGTSAATPHAAAAAALMLQSNSSVTAAQVLTALRTSASAMGAVPDFLSGYGFIQVDAALAKLPPAAPTISLSPTSITAGMSSTLTWSAANVTGCTASGSWSGTQVASGTQTVTPMASGSLTYTLTCTNAVGSANKSAVLSVQPAPSGGGGGGLDAAALLALAGLACARRLRGRRSTRSWNGAR